MKRRILALLLFASMLLSLAACGDKVPGGNAPGKSNDTVAVDGSDSDEANAVPSKKKDGIRQIEIDFLSSVVALSNQGDLYVIGKNGLGWAGIDDADKMTKAASNVKKFSDGGLLYIDNDDTLYLTGLNAIEGGTYKSYVKFGENVKDMSLCLGQIAVAASNDGKVSAFGYVNIDGALEFHKQLTEFNGISDAAQVGANVYCMFYIADSGELYVKDNREDNTFVKVLDNVVGTNGSSIFKTGDGKVYMFKFSDDYHDQHYIVEQPEAKDYVLTYFINGNDEITQKLSSEFVNEGLNLYYPDDVKTMLDMGTLSGWDGNAVYHYIYENTNGKIGLHAVRVAGGYLDKVDEYTGEADYTVDSMEEIYQFMQKSEAVSHGESDF